MSGIISGTTSGLMEGDPRSLGLDYNSSGMR